MDAEQLGWPIKWTWSGAVTPMSKRINEIVRNVGGKLLQ
jgi:hypothetical protein